MHLFKNWDAQRKTWLERIEEKVKFSREPLKDRIAHAVFRLENQLDKLRQTSSKLQQRDKEMFERCVGAESSHDDAHAMIYANECSEIRKFATIILASELALERVILRLKTVEEVGDVLVQMAPVVGIVNETKGRLAGIIPEVSQELDEINGMLHDTMLETGEANSTRIAIEAGNAEARQVLEEATAKAQQKIDEKFPDLPITPTLSVEQPPEARVEAEPRVEMESEGGGSSSVIEMPIQKPSSDEEKQDFTPPVKSSVEDSPPPTMSSRSIDDLEQLVLDFLLNSEGKISLSKCANQLHVPVADVRKTIDELVRTGKVQLT